MREPAEGPPPLSLHHIGIVVADIEKARDDYVNRFGYEICGPVIHDPEQTAHVLFLRMPNSSTYVELVSPDGPASKLSAALERGGGLNHLCYATPDIVATIEAMTQCGMRLIHSPVAAIAFGGRRIAWLIGRDLAIVELVEQEAGPLGRMPGFDQPFGNEL